MKHIHILVLILCGCFVSLAWGEPQVCPDTLWAEFHRHNMQRFNPCEKVLNVNNVGSLQVKWSYPIGRTDSPPILSNGVVYIRTDGGLLYAIKAGNGALLWSYQTAKGACCTGPSAAIANGVVYIGSLDGLVYGAECQHRCLPMELPKRRRCRVLAHGGRWSGVYRLR